MLLGRAAERQHIAALLEGATMGRSGVLAFVGEPGIGKTALLDYAAEEAVSFTVVRARGVESETQIPFGSLLELCRPVLGSLDRIPAPQAIALETALALRPGRPAERFAVGAAVLSLLASSAEDSPLLVIVDDVHWLDPSSGEALRFALRRLLADPIAVVLAARQEEPSFLDGTDIACWHVGGLAPSEAASLLAGSRLDGELSERAVAATGGNPLALVELGRGVDLFDLASGSSAAIPVPTALVSGFLREVESLDDKTRQLLVLAAAHDAGDAATLERAARLVGADFATITRAEAHGVLAVKDGRLSFRHPLARSAVYGAATPEKRREAHCALAAVLSDRDVDRRAWHLASAAIGTDATAAEAMRQAGERARQRSAYAVASAAFERAAALAADDDKRVAFLWRAADSSWQAGLGEGARELLSTAKAVNPDSPFAVDIAHLEGQITQHRGPVMESHAVLVAAARDAESDRAIEMLADATIACFIAGRPREMLATAAQAERLVTAGSSARARYLAAMAAGMSCIFGGDAEEGAALIGSAIGLVDAENVPDEPRWSTWLLMGPLWLRGSVATRAVVDRALEAARSRSAVGSLPFLLNYLARDQAGGDAWAVATACYDESIRVSRETSQQTQLAFALAGLAWLEARQGKEALCRSHAAESAELCRQLGMGFVETWTMAALGDLMLGLGCAEEAADRYEGQALLLEERGITDPDISPAPELVDVYLRLGRRDEATALAFSFDAAATAKKQPWSCARAARALGMVAEERTFEGCFENALQLHDETPDLFERARTLLGYGARVRRSRRRGEARPLLREAFGIFDRLGARPWMERTRVELDATGESIHSREAGALEKLTPQELQIALLLAEGRTTRATAAALFLSPKTVEYHLRHVYQKLGVRSREALRPALAMDDIPVH